MGKKTCMRNMHRSFSLILVVMSVLLVSLVPVQASEPVYSIGSAAVHSQKQVAMPILGSFVISNPDGTGFGNGYIEFNISEADAFDTISFVDSASGIGSVFVGGNDVFIMTGEGPSKIGVINGTYNGLNGQKLRVDLVQASNATLPVNNDFETGDLSNWTVVQISSVQETPELRNAMLATYDWYNGIYDLNNTGDSVSQYANIDSVYKNNGNFSLQLSNYGTSWQGYGYIWGPSVTSSSFSAAAGDTILFDWMATQTSDYYFAYALLIDGQNNETTVLFAQQGASSIWQTQEVVIPKTSGDLRFQFILGSYDNTGGQAVGALMRVDNIRTESVSSSTVTAIARAMTHTYGNDTLSAAVSTGRNITICAMDADGESSSFVTTLKVHDRQPSFISGDSFSVYKEETSLSKVLYDAQANDGDGGAIDQGITYSLVGGDGQALFKIDATTGEVYLNSFGINTLSTTDATKFNIVIRADDGQLFYGRTDLNVTVTLAEIAVPASEEPATSVSDSGRRASVSPGMPVGSVITTDTSVKHVIKGSNMDYDLSGGDGPVTGISFDPREFAGVVVAKVQVLKAGSEDIPVPEGKLYQMMSVDVGSPGTITSQNADNLKVRFKVSRDWINANNIDPASIRMASFNGNAWSDLPTSKVSEDDECLFFVAEAKEFTISSIIGDSKMMSVGDTTSLVEKIVTEETVATSGPEKSTPGFSVVLTLTFISAAFVVIRSIRK